MNTRAIAAVAHEFRCYNADGTVDLEAVLGANPSNTETEGESDAQ